jgi:hypothetical protein
MGDLKSGETVLVTGNTIFINKNIDIYLYIRHVFEITGIIQPVVSVLSLKWFIKNIYYRKVQFLNIVIFIK